MEFRDMLVKARKEKGYNQEELAERIGVSRQAVSKWETGDSQPALAQLIALADALDISLDILCGRDTISFDNNPFGESTPATDHGSGSTPTNHRARRRQLILRLLFGILIGSVLMFGIQGLTGLDIVSSEEAITKNQFPDTIEVTGLSFYGNSYEDNVLDFEFVPSYVNPDLTYTLHFRGFDKETYSFEVENTNGIFAGSAELPSGMGSYLVTLEISDQREDNTGDSRFVALASGLCFEKAHASWTPLTENP